MTNEPNEASTKQPRFHVEGQTSTAFPRWQIWDGQRHYARFRNIADAADATRLCETLNEYQDTMTRAAEPLRDEVERVAAALEPMLFCGDPVAEHRAASPIRVDIRKDAVRVKARVVIAALRSTPAVRTPMVDEP